MSLFYHRSALGHNRIVTKEIVAKRWVIWTLYPPIRSRRGCAQTIPDIRAVLQGTRSTRSRLLSNEKETRSTCKAAESEEESETIVEAELRIMLVLVKNVGMFHLVSFIMPR